MLEIYQKILSPWQIGSVKLENRLIMAPMAEVTNMITRKQMRRFGAAGGVSEMINVTGLKYNAKKNERYLAIAPEEHPVGIQLYGKQLEDFGPAAEYVCANTSADWLDLNFGCPAPKVIQNGGGVAMMKDPQLIQQVIRATKSSSRIPLTAKFRLGWDNSGINILETAQIAFAEGLSAIALHPRTRAERFLGHSHWEYIRELKKISPIPVIGSGDLFTPEDVIRMFQETACDAVMLARGAFGKPWLFRQVLELCRTGQYQKPDRAERIQIYQEHLREYIAFREHPLGAIREMRKYAAQYLRDFDGAAEMRRLLNQADTLEEIQAILS